MKCNLQSKLSSGLAEVTVGASVLLFIKSWDSCFEYLSPETHEEHKSLATASVY